MVNTEIYVNGVSIDLFDDLPLPLTYNIADIREPDKRNSNYSKNVNIPGSKNNNVLFGQIFEINLAINSTGDINFTPSFNPNLKAECVVYRDRIEVFRGILQLSKINVKDDYEIQYEVILLGKLINLYTNLGEIYLDQLDFSELDHYYTSTMQVHSWTNTSGGYVYPMIDYGQNNLTDWKVSELYPAVYLKNYFDKILSYGGFTYTPNSFTNSLSNYIIPFNAEKFKLSETAISNRGFSAYVGSNQDILLLQYSSSFYSEIIQINTDSSDPGNNYNTSTYKYTAPQNGNYKFSTTISFAIRLEPSISAYIFSLPTATVIQIIKEDINGNIVVLNSTSNLIFSYISISNNVLYSPGTIINASNNVTINVNNINLLQNEKVYVRLFHSGKIFYVSTAGGPIADVSGDSYFRAKSTSTTFSGGVDNPNYYEGDFIEMSNAVPSKIKAKDFLTSVIKAFNLYIEDDQDLSNNLIIYPRNDFYTSGVVDWTEKLDISQNITIEPMGALDARTYLFTYDKDEDDLNKNYQQKYSRLYGDRIIDIQNDFLKNKKEIKLIFAPTPSGGVNFTDRVIPVIKYTNNSGTVQSKTSKIRLLYWGGLKSCTPNWNLINSSGTITSYSTYPYSGHLDDPYNSTLDLNFGVPSEIYWSGSSIYYNNNNLYNKYYRKFIEEITDIDSKIVTAYFRLKESDIQQLDFRKLYFVNNTYYRLNKVIDYNPTVDGLTKVELLKIKEAQIFTATSGLIKGGIGTVDGIEPTPYFPNDYLTGENNNNGNNFNKISGSNNNVDGTANNIFVHGVDNVVGQGVNNVGLFNTSGCVVAADGVVLINSTGITATTPNSIYVNNRNITQSGGQLIIHNDLSTHTTSSSGVDNLLASYTLPANTLNTSGDCFIATGIFYHNTLNNQTVKINFPNYTSFSHTTSALDDIVIYTLKVTRITETTYQAYSWVVSNVATYATGLQNASSIDFTEDNPITVYGNPFSTTDIILYNFSVELNLRT